VLAPCFVVISGLSGSTTFFLHYVINGMIFGGGGGVVERNMCVLIYSIIFVLNISHS